MALVKVRNIGKSILFIDSLSLTLRPSNAAGDNWALVDEEKANNDSELMKCILLGSVEKCAINKEFKKIKEPVKEVVESKKVESKKVEVEEKVSVKDKKKVKNGTNIKKEEKNELEDPVNSESVIVVPGDKTNSVKTAKVKSYKYTDTKMPSFIKETDIRDLKTEDLDAESHGPPDIILSELDE